MSTAEGRTNSGAVALVVLMLVSIFSYLDRTILSILQVPIKKDLGLTDAQLGALTGLAFALFYATLSVPIARLADRFNRKVLIVISLLVWSLMTAMSGFAASFAVLVFFRIGVALGEAGSIPASHSILADYYRPGQRATALAVWGLSLPIGVMLGYLCGGWLAQAVDWRAALWIIGGAGVVLAPIVLLTLREPPRGRHEAPLVMAAPAPPWREALMILARLKSFRLMLLGGALNNFVLSVVLSWSAPFYTRLHGLTLGQVATALALLTGVGGAVGIFAGGWLTDRLGRHDASLRPRMVGYALAAVTPIGLAQYLVPSAAMSIVFGGLVVMLLFFYYAPIIALSHAIVAPSMRAFTSAIILLAVNIIGLGLGPWLTGALSDVLEVRFGQGDLAIRHAIAAVMTISLAAGLCFLAAARSYNADLARTRGETVA
jgi:predicted MFS family arabinose efflux permease